MLTNVINEKGSNICILLKIFVSTFNIVAMHIQNSIIHSFSQTLLNREINKNVWTIYVWWTSANEYYFLSLKIFFPSNIYDYEQSTCENGATC